jgi:hypothetical protein
MARILIRKKSFVVAYSEAFCLRPAARADRSVYFARSRPDAFARAMKVELGGAIVAT